MARLLKADGEAVIRRMIASRDDGMRIVNQGVANPVWQIGRGTETTCHWKEIRVCRRPVVGVRVPGNGGRILAGT